MKIINIHFIVLLLLCMIVQTSRAEEEQRERERKLYQKDFFLNLKVPEEADDEAEEESEIVDDAEEELAEEDEEDDKNQIVMLDDYFVLPPEGRQREDILFFFFLPVFFAILTLSLAWGYLRVWLHDKKDLHQTRMKLFKLRSEFRGKATDPEFHSQLKKTLRLPPGASSNDIKRKMPVQDKELHNMINKYDEKFRKSDS